MTKPYEDYCYKCGNFGPLDPQLREALGRPWLCHKCVTQFLDHGRW